ncbi:hypothetical protein HJFPF1_05799 [Paramyrothecium foliicola]|nr:hypothetical protein HJFPF1_05799 [Paramyrothecium foliicola]
MKQEVKLSGIWLPSSRREERRSEYSRQTYLAGRRVIEISNASNPTAKTTKASEGDCSLRLCSHYPASTPEWSNPDTKSRRDGGQSHQGHVRLQQHGSLMGPATQKKRRTQEMNIPGTSVALLGQTAQLAMVAKLEETSSSNAIACASAAKPLEIWPHLDVEVNPHSPSDENTKSRNTVAGQGSAEKNTRKRGRKQATLEYPEAQGDINKGTKRGHGTAFEDENDDDTYDGNPSSSRQQPCDDKKFSFLACPFYKRDGHRYYACLTYQLRRPKDVKQHLYRRHCQPEFYCSRCFELFQNASERDEHTRSASCTALPEPHFDGISAAQKKQLAQGSKRSESQEDQWYRMWDIIFPGHARPSSVYAGRYPEEMCILLRDTWEKRRSDIISSIWPSGKYETELMPAIRNIMERLLDNLEAEMCLRDYPGSTDMALMPRRLNTNMTDEASCDSTIHTSDFGGVDDFQETLEYPGTLLPSQNTIIEIDEHEDSSSWFEKSPDFPWTDSLSTTILDENLVIDWTEVQEYEGNGCDT